MDIYYGHFKVGCAYWKHLVLVWFKIQFQISLANLLNQNVGYSQDTTALGVDSTLVFQTGQRYDHEKPKSNSSKIDAKAGIYSLATVDSPVVILLSPPNNTPQR